MVTFRLSKGKQMINMFTAVRIPLRADAKYKGYVLRIHKETVHAAQWTMFILIALVVQNKKKLTCKLSERKTLELPVQSKSEALTL